jgi:hypothetical protein
MLLFLYATSAAAQVYHQRKAENKKKSKRNENRLVSGSPLQSDDNQAKEKQYTHAYILNRVTFIMYFLQPNNNKKDDRSKINRSTNSLELVVVLNKPKTKHQKL